MKQLRRGGTDSTTRSACFAEDNARCYESLSEQERDAIWNQKANPIEIEDESDELDLPTT